MHIVKDVYSTTTELKNHEKDVASYSSRGSTKLVIAW